MTDFTCILHSRQMGLFMGDDVSVPVGFRNVSVRHPVLAEWTVTCLETVAGPVTNKYKNRRRLRVRDGRWPQIFLTHNNKKVRARMTQLRRGRVDCRSVIICKTLTRYRGFRAKWVK